MVSIEQLKTIPQPVPEKGSGINKEPLVFSAYGQTIAVPRKDSYTTEDVLEASGADIQAVRRLLRAEKVPKSPKHKQFTLNDEQFIKITMIAFGSTSQDVVLPNGETERFKMRDEKRLLLKKLLVAYQNHEDISYETIYEAAPIPRARFNKHIFMLRVILAKHGCNITGPDYKKLNRNSYYSFAETKKPLLGEPKKQETSPIEARASEHGTRTEGETEPDTKIISDGKTRSFYELRKKPIAPESESSDQIPLGSSKDKPSSFKVQETARRELRSGIFNKLLPHLQNTTPVSETWDVYKFIEPLLAENNLGFDSLVKWFNKNTDREKVKQEILKYLELELINQYKISGKDTWENAFKTIKNYIKKASDLLV